MERGNLEFSGTSHLDSEDPSRLFQNTCCWMCCSDVSCRISYHPGVGSPVECKVRSCRNTWALLKLPLWECNHSWASSLVPGGRGTCLIMYVYSNSETGVVIQIGIISIWFYPVADLPRWLFKPFSRTMFFLVMWFLFVSLGVWFPFCNDITLLL